MCRRGYFIEGIGGAQFALPGAVERLRAGRSAAAGGQGAGTGLAADVTAGAGAVGPGTHANTLVLAAADPAQPYGAALPWPPRERTEHGRRPARVAGAYVVMVEDEPVLYVERGGRGLITLGADTGAGRPSSAPRSPCTRRCEHSRRRSTPAGRQARPGANRRRAGHRIAVGGCARRARLPVRAAAADAQRVRVRSALALTRSRTAPRCSPRGRRRRRS